MPRETRNIGASVRARLLDRARAERSDFQILLTRYALERLLYRLSVSEHRQRFILKGAMLFVIWVTDPFRPTRDLDLLGRGDSDVQAILDAFRAICALNVPDDGVVFDLDALQAAPIREEVEYGGVRVRTAATIAGARIPIQVDVGFGDAVTPAPLAVDYPTLLDNPAPHVLVYPVETVVAEKFEALTRLGMANSRLKDFYDLWLLSRTFDFDHRALTEAVSRTFQRRQTDLPEASPTGLTDEFAAAWSTQWRAFLGRERMGAVPGSLAAVVADLRDFLLPLTETPQTARVWRKTGSWSGRDGVDGQPN
jgi:predicted nucleotidyltransferase component of viral defense system